MTNKKGAIEMSMTTIIVIVLGVTLLILGLAFVRGVFGKISNISDTTFDKAQTMLGGLEQVDKLLTLSPDTLEVEKGKDEAVKIIIANFEQTEPITITARSIPSDDKLVCAFIDTFKDTSETYTIESGNQKSLALLIQDKDGPLRTAGCRVRIEGAPSGDNSATVLVRIIKAGGAFS